MQEPTKITIIVENVTIKKYSQLINISRAGKTIKGWGIINISSFNQKNRIHNPAPRIKSFLGFESKFTIELVKIGANL